MSKIIDEKGRLFGKISIIDIIVIIIAIILVFAVYTKFHANERTSTLTQLETVSYELSIDSVRGGIPDGIKAGDKIYDQENDVCLGTITGIETMDATKAVQMADGTYVNGPVEGRYDVVLKIDAECQISNGRIYAQSTDELNLNGEKKTYTKYSMFTGTITNINTETK